MQLQQVTAGSGLIPPRRIFLGSATAAMIGAFGTSVTNGGTVLAQRNREGDLVYGEIVNQFLAGVKKLQDTQTGEAARQIASSLRLLAVWGRANKLDERIRKELRDTVRRKGRAFLLTKRFDIDEELKIRGWKVPPGITTPVTPSDYSDALDDMLQHGITGHWSDYANAFEGAATQLDRRVGRLVRISTQADPSTCYGMNFMLMMLQTQAFLACSLGLALGPEFCLIASALVLGWQWHMWASWC